MGGGGWRVDEISAYKVKVKLSRYRPGVAHSLITAALEGGEWLAARSGRNLPPGKTRYPL